MKTHPTSSRFRVVSHVSVPTLTLEVDQPRMLRILKPFEQAPFRALSSDGEAMKPPMVTRVEPFTFEGESEGEHSLVGGTVLISKLDERFPDHTYAGRIFKITKKNLPAEKQRAGRANYYDYLVDEVELV